MRDLLVVVPSRGRPQFVKRLARAVLATSQAATEIVFGFDDDDETVPEAISYLPQAFGFMWNIGPRKQLGPYTNYLVRDAIDTRGYKAFASLGDDMVPRTHGWDKIIVDALDEMGGGIVWCNSNSSPGFPEQWAMSSEIVEALGWMIEPTLKHWYGDQVVYDLARMTRRGNLLPNVAIEHARAPGGDQTGTDSWALLDGDRVAYATWLLERAPADWETARKAVGG